MFKRHHAIMGLGVTTLLGLFGISFNGRDTAEILHPVVEEALPAVQQVIDRVRDASSGGSSAGNNGYAPERATPRGETGGDLDVYFSPKGGCTQAVVRELNAARRTVLVQAYSFTSA